MEPAAGSVTSASTVGQLQLSASAAHVGDAHVCHLKMTVPDPVARPPLDVVCVVDTSGSMCVNATLTGADGDEEQQNLEILDLAKHALKTVVHSLQPEDRLALISFANSASTVLQLTVMSEAGKVEAATSIESLMPNGQTNLWSGLAAGLGVLTGEEATMSASSEDCSGGRLQTLLLLTDGAPNFAPAGAAREDYSATAHVAALQQELQRSKVAANCQINTFGFGYSLDSQLLQAVATAGGGSFSFIPDAGFVGTAFVHAIANSAAVAATEVELALKPAPGYTIVEVPGFVDGVEASGYAKSADWTIRPGAINFGQARDIMVKVSSCSVAAGDQAEPSAIDLLTATLTCNLRGTSAAAAQSTFVTFSNEASTEIDRFEHRFEMLRLQLVQAIEDGQRLAESGQLDAAKAIAVKFVSACKCTPPVATRVTNLIDDAAGQIAEAFSRQDWYSRWGRHYLRSLLDAHRLQLCNNFKDPGVQDYGGELFKQVRDDADALFVKLPPPKPAYVPPAGARASPMVDMARYHDRHGGCFLGDCKVERWDSAKGFFREVRVDEVRRGDVLRSVTSPKGRATVECVVALSRATSAPLVSMPGGLRLTPFHPVLVDANSKVGLCLNSASTTVLDNYKWAFPIDVGTLEAGDSLDLSCTNLTNGASNHLMVFDFVLEENAGGTVLVNGITAATLGHGIHGDPVVSHAFFGSREAVLEDLQCRRGWADGLVALDGSDMRREPSTPADPQGRVIGFGAELQDLVPMATHRNVDVARAAYMFAMM